MPCDPSVAARRVKEAALAVGFTAVGIARADACGPEAGRLAAWLARGYEAGMRWMARDPDRRSDPRRVVPDAASVVSVALNYYRPDAHSADPALGRISRYAWGDDYHDVMGEKLRRLWAWMEGEFPGCSGRWYADTGPVLEKAWAERAGIGWIGKHANLITRDHGSWVFLGEIITTLELAPDAPAEELCGTCRLCIDACPTRAIVEPWVVDSGRCLSYITIEHRGDADPAFQGRTDGWIFGCDVCQDVCPWNRKFARPTEDLRFAPRPGALTTPLEEWAEMTTGEFHDRFRGSPVTRTGPDGLRRNARLAADGAGS